VRDGETGASRSDRIQIDQFEELRVNDSLLKGEEWRMQSNSHFANDRFSVSQKKERKERPDEDHDGGISERRRSD
jgi:hypothetical protein